MSTASSIADWEDAELGPSSRLGNPLAVAWRRKSLVMLGLCISIGIGLFYYSQVAPVYQSTAQVLVVRKRPESIPVNGSSAGQQVFIEDYLTTHAILIRSQEILRRAVKILELEEPGMFPAGSDGAGFLSKGLTVTREIRDGNTAPSNVLNLAFRGPNRDDCPLIVRAIIRAYQEFLNETYGDMDKEFVEQMKKAEKTLKEDIEERKKKYEDSVSGNLLALKSKDSLGGLLDKIARFETKHADLVLRQQEIKQTLGMIKSLAAKGENKSVILKVVERTDPNRTGAFDRRSSEEALESLLLQEEELKQELGNDHPQLISLRRRIEALRQRIGDTAKPDARPDPLEIQTGVLTCELELNQVMQTTVLGLLAKERLEANRVATLMHEMESAKEAIQPYQQLYDNVIARLNQLQLTRDSQIFRARTIVDAAPGIKVAPNLLLTLAVAIMFGSMGGMGLAYAAEWTDRGFHDPEEIRRRLGVPVVGHVPYLPPCNGADIVVEGHLCAYHSPKSPQAEAFRGLRTSLYFSTHGRGHQVIQMTSPNKGDGKSTLLANLAISIAHSGKSVVLVDADFRRPSIHSLFRLDRSPVGLATILLGEVDLERALRAGPAPGLSLILCGPRPAQPAELLTSPRFHELLTQLRDRFDFVLIDTPPLLAVTDPAVVAPRVDGVLLAVRLSKKCRPSAERAKELLASLGAKIVGVVVNGMNGFGVGGHGYDYSYGYDCGDDDGESDAESPPQDGLPGFIENGAATPTRHRVG